MEIETQRRGDAERQKEIPLRLCVSASLRFSFYGILFTRKRGLLEWVLCVGY